MSVVKIVQKTLTLKKYPQKLVDFIIKTISFTINRSSRSRGTPNAYPRGRRSLRGRPQPIVWQDQGE